MSIEKSEILSGLLKDRKYIRELGLYLKKQADSIKPGKEDELKAQLNEVGDYLVDLAKKNSGDPDSPPGAQRPLPRAGGAHHRPGRRSRHGDDRHQHGRPRHRHPARRQRPLRPAGLAEGGDRPAESSRAPPATDQIVEWIDDSLRDGDEWIDNRLKERIAEIGDGHCASGPRSNASRAGSLRQRNARKRARI